MIPWGWILLVILVVILIYALAGRPAPRSPEPSERSHGIAGQDVETALDILKKRYARGEISRDDFEQMKKDLSG